MGLLESPRHTVQVFLQQAVTDSMGAIDHVQTEEVRVRCNVHPVSANEAEQYGLILTDSYRITAPAGKWPGRPNSIIRWNGFDFKQVGRPRMSRMGVRTQADRIFMQRGQNTNGVS